MATKNNIRSIRFSDELAELIDQQIGDTFTAKFEALITRCVWELPRKEQELANIQTRIEAEKKRLKRIQEYAAGLEQNARKLDTTLLQSLNLLNQGTTYLKKLLETEP